MMKAVRLFAPGDVRCVEKNIPALENKEDVLIKVKSCGVCGSDIPRVMVKGAYHHPITIGHEFAGEVVECAKEVESTRPGDRVTVMPLIPCGICVYCKVGNYQLCDDYVYYGSRIEGAMAEYIVVSSNNILKLPDNVDYEAGSMTDPASIALHAVKNFVINPGQTGLVIGLGAIGLFAVQWLKILGCGHVFAVDVYDEKLELAANLGADVVINAKKQDVIESVKKSTEGSGVDFSVELAGNKNTQVLSIDSVKKKGHVVFCGISYDDLTLPNSVLNKILRHELTISGAWNSSVAPYPINEWKTSLDFMDNGSLAAKPLITHRFGLEECGGVFDMMFKRKEMFTKILFKPEQ
jgi:L-iditol 2-dehydrogenase